MQRFRPRKTVNTRIGRRSASRRRGQMALPLLFIIPVLFLVTLAAVQYGIWSVARQTVASSAIDGARVAASNGSVKEIVKAVDKSLAKDKMRFSTKRSVVVIEKYGVKPVFVGNRNLIQRLHGPQLRPGEIRVTVCILPGARTPVWVRWSKKEPKLRSSSLLAAH